MYTFFENLRKSANSVAFSVFETLKERLTVMTDTRLALCDVHGPLSDFLEKLSGEEGSSLWLPAFKRFLRKESPWEKEQPPFPLLPRPIEVYPTPFTPGLTWKERIERCKFDYVDPDIWTYIDSFVDVEEEDSSPLTIELDHFEKSMSSDKVESFQAENGKEMTSPARFLHLCEQHPDLQRKHPIVCTQKVCVGRHGRAHVLYAREGAGRRSLYLPHCDVGWDEDCRFPSTRNVSSGLGAGTLSAE